MINVRVQSRLDACRPKIDVLEKFVGALAESLAPPIIYESGMMHWGYRYTNPDVLHFCLLKAVRSVSGLNAIFELVRSGYTQEIVVIIRSIVECTSHIKFALVDFSSGGRDDVRRYIEDYFLDYARNSVENFRRPKVRQADLHRAVGETLDDSMLALGKADEFQGQKASKLMSNIYLNYSNYVHSRYPEVMDLYGGSAPHFHLRGMSGTPKDHENIITFEAQIDSVSLCFKQMCIDLDLKSILNSDMDLFNWFKSK